MREKNVAGKTKAKADVVSDSCYTTSDYTTDAGDSTEDGDQSHYWHQDELASFGRKRKRKPTGPAARYVKGNKFALAEKAVHVMNTVRFFSNPLHKKTI